MDNEKFTKIVATLGPASDSKKTIRRLIKAGVNVFRFNTKHGTPEWHEERINKVQQIADELGEPIGILIDLQGPELRIETRDDEDIKVKKGQTVILESSFSDDDTLLVIPHAGVIKNLKRGDQVLINDGKITMEVATQRGNKAYLKPHKDYTIKNRKGVNIPGKVIDMPSLIEADLDQLEMASRNKIDFVALSFVRDVSDVEILRKEMENRKLNAKVVVKIENQEALNNIDELIEASDAVMVARGDLGVEVPIEKLAYWQRIIIDKCQRQYKPVITATEMLESMIDSPRPTRAEATDVSNAVFEGTDSLMLSGETASGNYPIETVITMSRIARFTESVKEIEMTRSEVKDKTQLIGRAAMEMVLNGGINVDKIVVFTQSGYTARVVSSFRPTVPIIAVTENQNTVEALTLSYGVKGYKFRFPSGRLVSPNYILDKLGKKGVIKKGEDILVIHGAEWKKPGLTNSTTLVTY